MKQLIKQLETLVGIYREKEEKMHSVKSHREAYEANIKANTIEEVLLVIKNDFSVSSEPDEKVILNIMVRQGKLHAVKYIKDTFDWDLRTAKNFCDKLEEESGLSKLELRQYYINSLLKEGRGINAIKEVKECTGWNLNDCKAYIKNFKIY